MPTALTPKLLAISVTNLTTIDATNPLTVSYYTDSTRTNTGQCGDPGKWNNEKG
jgi:hypothetical protein